jgi:hypothetical protein
MDLNQLLATITQQQPINPALSIPYEPGTGFWEVNNGKTTWNPNQPQRQGSLEILTGIKRGNNFGENVTAFSQSPLSTLLQDIGHSVAASFGPPSLANLVTSRENNRFQGNQNAQKLQQQQELTNQKNALTMQMDNQRAQSNMDRLLTNLGVKMQTAEDNRTHQEAMLKQKQNFEGTQKQADRDMRLKIAQDSLASADKIANLAQQSSDLRNRQDVIAGEVNALIKARSDLTAFQDANDPKVQQMLESLSTRITELQKMNGVQPGAGALPNINALIQGAGMPSINGREIVPGVKVRRIQ